MKVFSSTYFKMSLINCFGILNTGLEGAIQRCSFNYISCIMCEKPQLMSDFHSNFPVRQDCAFEYEKVFLTTHIPSQRQESSFGKTWRFLYIKFGKIAIKVRIPYCDSHDTALWDLLISFDANISSTMAFLHLGISDHVVVSVSIDFPINSKQDAPFQRIAHDYSRGNWDGLCDHLRDVPLEDTF